ncbi:thioredoxin [Ferrovibrio sp.]|uniref:thioredoxin n=3 Tax=Ferrovibrio sp. TaxID=1917215 RepID=UPI0035B1E700
MIALGDIGANPANPAGDDLVKDVDISTFMQDVVQASQQVPVLVDFWAPWCGPCKTLGPQLEKLTREAKGKFKLVKVNVDDPRNQPLAQQLRIQSIPAVFAFAKGQPVDGFVGALPESQLKGFIQQVISAAGGEDPLGDALEAGKAALAEQDWETAAQSFSAALGEDAQHAVALGGLARAMVGLGELEEAEHILSQVPAAPVEAPEVAAARSALQLARQAGAAAGQLAPLEAAVAANPADHQARYDYAIALVGDNRQEEAMDHLLQIVKRDRKWNDEAARKQLLQMFEAMGPMDPLVVDARRKLASILFA